MTDLTVIWEEEDLVPDGGPSGEATEGSDTIIGDDGDNTLGSNDPVVGRGFDLIYGAGGNDTLHGGNGADELHGGAGDDQVNGDDGSDFLFGGSGNDTLDGGGQSDILVGGAGDDVLAGGPGNDSFEFRFCVSDDAPGAVETFSDYFRAQTGSDLGDDTTQSQFSVQYTAWLSLLVETYGLGSDEDGDGVIEVELNQNDPDADATPWIEGMSDEDLEGLFSDRQDLTVKTGRTTQERSYSDTFSTGAAPIQGEGHDTIIDWSSENDRVEDDTLYLVGLSNDESADNYWGDWLTVDEVDDGQTVISWDGGSITLVGVDTTIEALIAANDLLFSDPTGA